MEVKEGNVLSENHHSLKGPTMRLCGDTSRGKGLKAQAGKDVALSLQAKGNVLMSVTL